MREVGIDVTALPAVPARVAATVMRKVESGDMYDAQQLVKTFSNRYRSKGEPAVSVSICKEFALQFASRGLGALALDLSNTALHCMQEQPAPPTEEQLQLIADLLQAATQEPKGGPTAKDISAFVGRAVKWSRTPESPVGSLLLHRAAAAAYLRFKNYGLCQGHLVYGGDAEALGNLMQVWVPLGYPSERGFFWLRLVLMLLSLRRVAVADELLRKYSGVQWESDEVSAPLQLAYLSVAACKVQSIAAFNLLLRKYNVLLKRDPFLTRCFEQIKLEVFGVSRQQPASLSSLFSNFFAAPIAAEEAAPTAA